MQNNTITDEQLAELDRLFDQRRECNKDATKWAQSICFCYSHLRQRLTDAEARLEAADEVYNRLNAKGEHAGARRQGWEAGLVDFADHLNAEADRLEKGATNGQ